MQFNEFVYTRKMYALNYCQNTKTTRVKIRSAVSINGERAEVSRPMVNVVSIKAHGERMSLLLQYDPTRY